MGSTKKILILGDTHGDVKWSVSMVARARRQNCSKIIQVGDFGLWDHHEDGVRFLDTLNEACRKHGVKFYWVDGNHENHDRLSWYVENNPRTFNGFVYIRSHILYIPRGLRWNWNDKWFMGVGGAVSVDKEWRLSHERKPRTLWWPGEQLTDEQVAGLPDDKRVDYLFTHDCPTNAPFRYRLKPDVYSQIHRQRMNVVGNKLKPRLWFHGHMHEKYEYQYPDYGYPDGTRSEVRGLGMNGNFFSAWGVLDTDSDVFTYCPQDPDVINNTPDFSPVDDSEPDDNF